MDKKNKSEQLFLLIIIGVVLFGAIVLTGCGGKCERIRCESEEHNGIEEKVVSIPGCGGLLGCEKGCGSTLWAQSIRYVYAEMDDTYDLNGETRGGKGCVLGCDIRYLGDGCGGCGKTEKSSYTGFISLEGDGEGMKGCFKGSSDSEEVFLGYFDSGCVTCGEDGYAGGLMIHGIEIAEGIY